VAFDWPKFINLSINVMGPIGSYYRVLWGPMGPCPKGPHPGPQTRYFLMFGVFVGLFWGQRKGHFGEIGPFYAHFSPEASKRGFLGSGILFLAMGAAAGDRPPTGLGFGLAARG
jgi:hypothetical protein